MDFVVYRIFLEFRLFCIFGFYLAKAFEKRILWRVLRQFRQLTQYEIRNKAEKTGEKGWFLAFFKIGETTEFSKKGCRFFSPNGLRNTSTVGFSRAVTESTETLPET